MTEEEIRVAADELLAQFSELVDGQPALAVAAAMGRTLGETIDDPDLVTICVQTAAANAWAARRDMESWGGTRTYDPDMITTTTRH